VLTWINSGLRPVVAVVFALVGLVLTARSLLPGLRDRVRAAGVIKLVLFSLYGALLVMTLAISAMQLTTVQALRSMGMLLLGSGGIAMLLLARAQSAKTSKTWQLIIGVITALALVAIGLVTRIDSSATRFRVVLPAAMAIGAAILLGNTLVEFALAKRTFGDPAADRLGRKLQVFGGILAVLGITIRLLYTNFTPEHAKALRAAGKPVPQNVLRETVLWWLIVAAIGAYVLVKTKWGNWIFAVGGNKDAARAIGVPANQVKIALFVVVGICGALSGTLLALR
jgi:ribose/xylose/arabinose/galactoside ABC-type transport system permease subunit